MLYIGGTSMTIIRTLCIILITSFILCGCSFFGDSHPRTYPATSDNQFFQIHELKQNNLTTGLYNTEGYVVFIYACPVCSPTTTCKLCMRDNFVISESNKITKGYSLNDDQLIIFTPNKDQHQMALGKKYKLTINITDYKSTGDKINDINLIGYDLLEER
jgi:hypothetical protein